MTSTMTRPGRPMRSLVAVAVLMVSVRAGALEKLTLEQAVQRAVEHAPAAQMAATDVRRAMALLDQARASYGPAVMFNATVSQLDGDRKVGDRVLAPATSANANVQASIPLLSFQRRAQAARAEDAVSVADAVAADVKRSAAQGAARAFVAIVTQQRLVEAARSALATATEHARHARERLDGGVGNQVDVLRALQEVAASEAQLATAEGGLERTREALAILVASEEPVDAVPPSEIASVATVSEALAQARSRRSDLAAANVRVKVSERSVGDAWVDALPTLSLLVQPFFQAPATVTQPTIGGQALLVFALPLWDSGLRRAQQAERDAILEQARAQLAALERSAAGEVRVAFAFIRHADEALAAARRSASTAKEMLGLATTAFQAGVATSLEVVDAEQRARQADVTVAIAEDQSRQARLELLIACGRLP